MKWSDFETRLRGEHLGNKRFVLTIKDASIEDTHPRPGQTKQAPVLYFAETKKSLALSLPNMRTLAGLFGDDIEACVGKRISLEAVPMKVAGRDTLPIRIGRADAVLTSGKPTVNGETGEIEDEPDEFTDDAQAEAAAEG
jgi:hypothetical protein